MPVDPEFERLVKTYYQELYRFGFSLTQSEADACDLTQQTFYIWANKGHQLKDATKVKAWLFTTLHREFLQMFRREERFSAEPFDAVAESLAAVPVEIVNRIDARKMLEILRQIDEAYRSALVLYYQEDLSYKDIADVLGIPLGTVQSRIARGKTQLLQLLTESDRPLAQSK